MMSKQRLQTVLANTLIFKVLFDLKKSFFQREASSIDLNSSVLWRSPESDSDLAQFYHKTFMAKSYG